jgi:hypothetical membrane protein
MEASSPTPQSKFIIIAGYCGICIPLVIFTCITLALLQSPWFNWTQHALSDLGIEGISSIFFNSGMILGGILSLIFSIGLKKILSNPLGAYALMGSSIFLIGIGLIPETIFIPHVIISASFFLLLAISLILIAFTAEKTGYEKTMGRLALLCACIAIGSIVFLIPLDGIAIPETITLGPAFLWCLIFGTKMSF